MTFARSQGEERTGKGAVLDQVSRTDLLNPGHLLLLIPNLDMDPVALEAVSCLASECQAHASF